MGGWVGGWVDEFVCVCRAPSARWYGFVLAVVRVVPAESNAGVCMCVCVYGVFVTVLNAYHQGTPLVMLAARRLQMLCASTQRLLPWE
jgi:hypothetical protein